MPHLNRVTPHFCRGETKTAGAELASFFNRKRQRTKNSAHDVVILRLVQTDLARIAPSIFLDAVRDMPCAQSLTNSILVTARP